MYSVIMCGGAGTRLWPLSRKNFPKQFLKLYSDNSLLQETFLRMRKIMPAENIFFITNQESFYNVANQIKEVQKGFNEKQVIVEPIGLDTAPAITLAIKYLLEKIKISPDAPLIILPADHYIGNEKTYLELVQYALKNIDNHIGTIGIIPTKPETGFGYIKKGEKINNYFKVLEFKEKPDLATATDYLASGQYVWNSGMYLFTPKTFVKELKLHSPEIFHFLKQPYDDFIKNFSLIKKISIDYAIAEKSNNVITFAGDFSWSDIGSFDNLAEILDTKNNGHTKHIGVESKNVFTYSKSNKLIVTLGVDDINVIENNDSILIQKKGDSEKVKKLVNILKDNEYKEIEDNLMVYRPWGKYEVLVDSPSHKVKIITVNPGAILSLQAHYHRVEHWVVIKGLAKIVNGEKNILLKENESTFIPALTKHRLENPGKMPLEIVEVQTGRYLEEDDILRFDDIYNRK